MNRHLTARNISIAGLIVINVATVSMLTHLMFFAGKGARYTAMDGAQERSERVLADLELQRQQEAERQERITSDLALAARVDLLHNLLEESCGHGL